MEVSDFSFKVDTYRRFKVKKKKKKSKFLQNIKDLWLGYKMDISNYHKKELLIFSANIKKL